MGESSRIHKFHGHNPQPSLFLWKFLRWTGFNTYRDCDSFHSFRPTSYTNPNAVGTSVCATNRSPDNATSDSYTNTHTDPNQYLYAHSDENTDENVDQNTNEDTYPD